MSPTAIDIETVPLRAALDRPYPEADRDPPANYKSPEAIYGWREKDIAAWEQDRIKQYSLSPLTGRVVAVGVASDPPGDFVEEIVTESLIARTEADERDLLTKLWIRCASADPLVTWNGMGFDVPFLLTRSAILGVPTPRHSLLKRYATAAHYDVKMVVNGWDSYKSRGTTLDDWAQAFGLGGKSAHGSQVYEMYRAADFASIGAYAADDARLTLALYHRVAHVFA
jgi:hypothetical protein